MGGRGEDNAKDEEYGSENYASPTPKAVNSDAEKEHAEDFANEVRI
jgi:hypothetical protein